MKKIILAVVLVMTMAMTVGCSQKNESRQTLVDKGLDMISKVNSITDCSAYTDMITSSDELRDVYKELSGKNFEKPESIFVVSNIDNAIYKAVLDDESISDEVRNILDARILSGVANIVNSEAGDVKLAALSSLSYGNSFVYDGLNNSTMYIFTYGNGYSYIITFVPGDDKAVSGNVQIVYNEELSSAEEADKVKDIISDIIRNDDFSVVKYNESSK